MLAYSRGYKFQVEEPYSIKTTITGYNVDWDWYTLNSQGYLLVRKGYAWDGATGWIDVPSIIRPSMIHDVFCQMMRRNDIPHIFRYVNEYFYQECLRSGMWKAHAMAVRNAVNLARSGDPSRGPDKPTLWAR